MNTFTMLICMKLLEAHTLYGFRLGNDYIDVID